MGVFAASGRQYVPGQKELTKFKESKILNELSGSKVFFPLVGPNGAPVNLNVKEGDTVKVGTRLGVRTDVYVPFFSSVSGTVTGTENRYNAVIGRLTPHLVIVSDGKHMVANDVLKTIDPDKADASDIITAICEAGIVGLGGAGFPTFVKYENAKSIKAVLINGVECEPLMTTDFMFMKMYAEDVVEGAELLRKAAGASEAVIAFKEKRQPLPEIYARIIADYPHIRVVEVPDLYPMGYEKTLVKQVFNLSYNKLPLECGIVVNNAQTAAAVFRALIKGEPLTHRLLTVSGNAVVNPVNIQVPLGLPVADVIDACGGYKKCEEVLLINGGPMTGKAMLNDSWVIQAPMGAISVMFPPEYRKQSAACIHCGLCTFKCPVGIQPVEIKKALDAKNYEHLAALQPDKCIECGLCSFVCPSKIEIADAVKRAKTMLKFQQARQGKK